MIFFRLLSLILICSLAACQKENIKEIIENPPVIVPDTIFQESAGTFSVGNSQLALDTAHCFAINGFDPVTGNQFNFAYVLTTGIDAFESPLGLYWQPPTNTETMIQSTTYSGLQASATSPSTIEIINNWVLQGENPNTMPFGGDIPTEDFNATGVNITVNNLIYSISEEDLGGGLKRIIDRGIVQLDGNLINSQGSLIPISGKFVCFFERYEM
jgi:hypothetical protein